MTYLLRAVCCTALVALFACTPKNSSKMVVSAPAKAEEPSFDTLRKPAMGDAEIEENRLLEGIDIKPESAVQSDTLGPYQPSHTFEHDLIHTKIEISFDWAKKRALGKTTLTLRPWFYSTDRVSLDAKNFEIKSVSFEGRPEQLKYS